MNWKAIIIGGLIGFILIFLIDYLFVFLTIYGTISFAIGMFIGGITAGILAGILSPVNAWKNGVGAGIFLTICNVIKTLLFMDLQYHNLIIDVFGAFIIVLIWYSIIGAIGGFIGGKIKS